MFIKTEKKHIGRVPMKALRQSQGVRMFIFTPRVFILERRVTPQKRQLYHKLSLKYCTGQRKREQIELSLFFVLK